ncbi:MAG TPA: hypothetical protein VID03_11065 [Acidimicrobiia bacterium]|jgi:hypothetical protein
MRTTIALDPDVKAIIDQEQRPGESARQTINRLIRASQHQAEAVRELPLLPGSLRVDISDVSEVLSRLEEEGEA